MKKQPIAERLLQEMDGTEEEEVQDELDYEEIPPELEDEADVDMGMDDLGLEDEAPGEGGEEGLTDEQIVVVKEFVLGTPDLNDEQLHDFAEENELDPELVEEVIYNCAYRMASKLRELEVDPLDFTLEAEEEGEEDLGPEEEFDLGTVEDDLGIAEPDEEPGEEDDEDE